MNGRRGRHTGNKKKKAIPESGTPDASHLSRHLRLPEVISHKIGKEKKEGQNGMNGGRGGIWKTRRKNAIPSSGTPGVSHPSRHLRVPEEIEGISHRQEKKKEDWNQWIWERSGIWKTRRKNAASGSGTPGAPHPSRHLRVPEGNNLFSRI